MKAAAAFLFLFLHFDAAAQIVNGDFESPAIAQNSSMRISPGEEFLTGWSISGGDVMLADFPGSAVDGTQFLHLLGESEALIEQELTTEPGQLYEVSFDYSEATFLAPFVGMEVFWNEESVGAYFAEPDSPEDVFWKAGAISVMGTGSDLLGFRSMASGSEGYYLDNLQLAAVPEPAEVGLFVALGLLGLAGFRWGEAG